MRETVRACGMVAVRGDQRDHMYMFVCFRIFHIRFIVRICILIGVGDSGLHFVQRHRIHDGPDELRDTSFAAIISSTPSTSTSF